MGINNVMWFMTLDFHALHLCKFLVVGSWITWFISIWDKNNCCYKLSNQLFSVKMVRFENCFESLWVKVVVILWICSAFNMSYFCLSLRFITWFMSQQPKTNTDAEHLYFSLIIARHCSLPFWLCHAFS